MSLLNTIFGRREQPPEPPDVRRLIVSLDEQPAPRRVPIYAPRFEPNGDLEWTLSLER